METLYIVVMGTIYVIIFYHSCNVLLCVFSAIGSTSFDTE